MTRFRILIVDDQHDEDGWGRVLAFLETHHYISESTMRQITCPEDAAIEWKIVTSGNCSAGSPFEEACNLLRDHRDDFVAFFIDLDLSKNNFLPEAFEGKKYSSTSYEQLPSDERASAVAGLDLLRYLPPSDEPKILFSGSSLALAIRRPFEFVASRLTDIAFPNIDDADDKREQIVPRLDAVLRRRQQAVVARMPSNQRATLVEALRRVDGSPNSDSWVQLRGFEIGVDDWTVGTLFPRESNLGLASAVLAAIAFDWRAFHSTLFNHCNAQAEDPFSFMGGVKHAVAAAQSEDLIVTKEDIRLAYPNTAICSAFEKVLECDDQNRSLDDLAYVRQELLGSQGAWYKASGVTVQRYLEKAGLEVSVVKNLAKNYGLRPIDLAYLVHIAAHNAHHADSAADDVQVVVEPHHASSDVVTIRFITAPSGDAGVEFDEKLEGAVKNVQAWVRSWHTSLGQSPELATQGLADVCTIVCGCYRGSFALRTLGGSVEVTFDESRGEWTCCRTEQTPEGASRSEYELRIKAP